MVRALRWWAVATVLSGTAAGAAAQPGAMLVDVQGKCTIEQAQCEVLQHVKPGQVLVLGASAKAKLAFYTRPVEAELVGPAQARMRAGDLDVLEGKPARLRNLDAGLAAGSARATGKTRQFALTMRGGGTPPRGLQTSPVNTAVLERPTLRWRTEGSTGLFRIRLEDAAGNTLLEREVRGSALPIPESLGLSPDVRYYWSVEFAGNVSTRGSRAVWFEVLATEERTRLEATRPPVDAPFSSRVLYAKRLEDHRLREDAAKAWQALHRERPGEPRLARRARQGR